jgi:ferritin-like metal-binding protein YciE
MEMESLRDLFIDQLKDIYSAETQVTKALPKMVKAASSTELQEAFKNHLEETQQQIKRLDQIFSNLGKNPRGKKCKGMQGLLEEGEELMEEDAEPEVLDAGLIAAAQRVEHYEISAYGTVRAYARVLGDDRAASLLAETLKEESKTDELLNQLAEDHINIEARNRRSSRM